MTKFMISQPMKGKTSEQIAEEREQIAVKLRKKFDHVEIMDTTVKDHENKSALECFSESIMFMAQADILVMAENWQMARGCELEYRIAKAYGKHVIYEVDLITKEDLEKLAKEACEKMGHYTHCKECGEPIFLQPFWFDNFGRPYRMCPKCRTINRRKSDDVND